MKSGAEREAGLKPRSHGRTVTQAVRGRASQGRSRTLMRGAKIEALRESIAKGTYRVSDAELAEKLIDAMLKP